METTVFVDGCSCWTLCEGLYFMRRKSSRPKCNTISSKGSTKVHIFGGITWAGPMPYIVSFCKLINQIKLIKLAKKNCKKLFDNNLSTEGYKIIVDEIIGPYMRTFNDGNCRLFQDNAPSHCNDTIYQALRNNNVNWGEKIITIEK